MISTAPSNRDEDSPIVSSIISSALIAVGVCFCIGACAVCFYMWRRRQQNEVKRLSQMFDHDVIFDEESVKIPNTVDNDDIRQDTLEADRQEDEKRMLATWLETIVCLPQYYDLFVNNGYESMQFVVTIPSGHFLRDIGIESVKHQKKIMKQIRLLQKNEKFPIHSQTPKRMDHLDVLSSSHEFIIGSASQSNMGYSRSEQYPALVIPYGSKSVNQSPMNEERLPLSFADNAHLQIQLHNANIEAHDGSNSDGSDV